jgi:hypothetical protein
MRRLRNAINPFSTGFTRWWCHSSVRAILNGNPRGASRRLARRRRAGREFPFLDERVNRERAAAIDRLIAEEGPESLQP